MPARKDRDASITIRFAKDRYADGGIEELFPIKKLISFFEGISDCFLIGLEQPGLKSSQHYECALILREDAKISDDLKRRVIRYVDDSLEYPLSPEERNNAVSCHYHNNIKLRFGYCSKEYVAYSTGVSPEFLAECKDVYEKGKRSEKSLPVSRSRLLPLIREMYKILWEEVLAINSEKMAIYDNYDNCKKFSILEKMLIIRGYDLTCISPSNKREIINNFDEYIVGYSENHMEDQDLIK